MYRKKERGREGERERNREREGGVRGERQQKRERQRDSEVARGREREIEIEKELLKAAMPMRCHPRGRAGPPVVDFFCQRVCA